MTFLREKINIYINNLDLILSDKFNFKSSALSISDLKEIDELYSLYIMHKNGVIGKLKNIFNEKLKILQKEIKKEELFKLFESLENAHLRLKKKRHSSSWRWWL
jgi:hypothetical protein